MRSTYCDTTTLQLHSVGTGAAALSENQACSREKRHVLKKDMCIIPGSLAEFQGGACMSKTPCKTTLAQPPSCAHWVLVQPHRHTHLCERCLHATSSHCLPKALKHQSINAMTHGGLRGLLPGRNLLQVQNNQPAGHNSIRGTLHRLCLVQLAIQQVCLAA